MTAINFKRASENATFTHQDREVRFSHEVAQQYNGTVHFWLSLREYPAGVVLEFRLGAATVSIPIGNVVKAYDPETASRLGL